ncbi:ATP-binding cassette, subfamily B [Ligilactobacillus sp. WC1T17]|uniref:ATP-binding cassette, subfamily B n=1 Tax=Ligilactobacillus ruminis TaxID=1623 RepID=A0ABY1ADL8_9LACO|nr:ATP-binding cassette, subfamily B [Ligilactobacillus ruminis]
MENVKKYLKYLFKTYSLFFKAAKAVTLVIIILTPLEAFVPLASVQASQEIVNRLSRNQGFMTAFIIWVIATFLIQLLPAVRTNIQGVLTDKLTGFVNISLMKKSRELKFLELFDDSEYFDNLKMLQSDASWRPVNLIVFGMSILQQLLILLGMFILLGSYNIFLTLVLLTVLVPQTLVYYKIQQAAFETMVTRSKNARKLDYLSSLLLDRQDAKEVRLFSMFKAVIFRYTNLFNQTQKTVNSVRKKQMWTATFFLTLVILTTSYGFYWFIVQVQNASLAIGSLLMYISVVAYITDSMTRLVEDASLLYDSLLWIEKYYDFMDYHETKKDGKQLFTDTFEQLAVKNLSFTYPFSNHEVLHNVSFTVKNGEKIAIVGENGSGKTTLVKLLLRFYDCNQGSIMWDKTDIKSYDIEDYRQHFSAVFQDFSRFKLSLQDNLTAMNEKKRDLKEILRKVGLYDKFKNDGVTLQTILSKEFQGGVDLSGGQWQKVALARDLYMDRPIEILDEPTAALDARSEQEIYEIFLNENRNKTIFFITHRMSLVNLADKVLYLKDGQVHGFATHEQLMQDDPDYRELYEIQRKAYINS